MKDDGSAFVIDSLDDASICVCSVDGSGDGNDEVRGVLEGYGTGDFSDLGWVVNDDDIAGSNLFKVLYVFAVGTGAGSIFNPILTIPGTERCGEPVVSSIGDDNTNSAGEPGRSPGGECFNRVVVNVWYVDLQVQVGVENIVKNTGHRGCDNLPPQQGGIDDQGGRALADDI